MDFNGIPQPIEMLEHYSLLPVRLIAYLRVDRPLEHGRIATHNSSHS